MEGFATHHQLTVTNLRISPFTDTYLLMLARISVSVCQEFDAHVDEKDPELRLKRQVSLDVTKIKE